MMYENWCRLRRIINGNTIEADINLWFNLTLRQQIRLNRVENTPDSFEFLKEILPETFKITTKQMRKIREGRVLAELYVPDNDNNDCLININDVMISKGFIKKSLK